jgi:hypothetical protein
MSSRAIEENDVGPIALMSVDHARLVEVLADRDRPRREELADDNRHLVDGHELASRLDRRHGVALGVLDRHRELLSEHAVAGVDPVHGQLRPAHLVLADRGTVACGRCRNADLHLTLEVRIDLSGGLVTGRRLVFVIVAAGGERERSNDRDREQRPPAQQSGPPHGFSPPLPDASALQL